MPVNDTLETADLDYDMGCMTEDEYEAVVAKLTEAA